MRDLLLSLPDGSRPRAGLERELRAAIREGRLPAGAVLPSSRALAADLGIARSTVVTAYEQLAIEGYLHASQGRSTIVATLAVPTPAAPDHNPMGRQPDHDFRPGEPALGSFPRRDWQRSTRRVLDHAPDEAFGYGDPRGRLELREALAAYLTRARKAHVDARSVRVHAGFASALGFVGELMRRQGVQRIGVEDPMLSFHRQILELTGLETVVIPVDGDGLRVDDLSASGAGAVLVTPASQMPLTVTMAPGRREALVAWAHETDGWIIEDDHDGEFRYDRSPIGALQGLDPDRVVYAGSASKTLSPGLRLSWLVVPPTLRPDLATVTNLRAGVSTIDQLALADFIERGAYDRHIRRWRSVYQKRGRLLLDRLAAFSWLDGQPVRSGLHLVALIEDRAVAEADVLTAAEESSVGLIGLNQHFGHHRPGLVIGFSRPAEHHVADAIDRLIQVLADAA